MKKNIFFILNTLFFIATSQAQKTEFNEKYLADGVYSFDESIRINKREVFTTFKNEFGLGKLDEMNEESTYFYPEEGIFQVKYTQKFKGYPVEGAMMNILGHDDVVERINGFVVTNLKIDDENLINQDVALKNALNFVNAEKYAWQETELDEDGNNFAGKYYPKGELVISKIRETETPFTSEYYKLCYRFNIRVSIPYQNLAVYIDANNGTVFTTTSESSGSYPTSGTVNTWYNGTRVDELSTSGCFFCSNYFLEDQGRNITTKTWDDYKIKDYDGFWGDEGDRTPAGAHWAVGKAWDYFATKHNKTGTDGNKKEIRIIKDKLTIIGGGIASYSFNTGFNRDEIALRTDDPSLPKSAGFSVAALDVMAHEYTHGMIFRSSNLQGGGFEAKSLGEGFCDIFGELVENQFHGPSNFIAGFNLGTCKGRNFYDPHSDCGQTGTNSAMQSPGRYLETGIWSTTNEHADAGILRKWFHLLAFGGTHNGVSVSGVGLDIAGKIAFLSFNSWLNTSVNYPTAATLITNGTKFQYGNCSPEHIATYKAFKAVGLNPPAPNNCTICCLPAKIANQNTSINASGNLEMLNAGNKAKSKAKNVETRLDVMIYPDPTNSLATLILPVQVENTKIEILDL